MIPSQINILIWTLKIVRDSSYCVSICFPLKTILQERRPVVCTLSFLICADRKAVSMVINMSIGKVKSINWIFIIGICGTTALWLNRLNLGAANYDEIFYLTLPYRLTLGDTLIFDEWSTPQLTGFILWPIMSIYKFFFSSNWNGVALNFRYIWLLFHQGTTIVAYLFLKKHYHGWSAACAAILYSAFVPFGIMALSYNSIGLATAFLLSILFS